jgi:hypothetical protein
MSVKRILPVPIISKALMISFSVAAKEFKAVQARDAKFKELWDSRFGKLRRPTSYDRERKERGS